MSTKDKSEEGPYTVVDLSRPGDKLFGIAGPVHIGCGWVDPVYADTQCRMYNKIHAKGYAAGQEQTPPDEQGRAAVAWMRAQAKAIDPTMPDHYTVSDFARVICEGFTPTDPDAHLLPDQEAYMQAKRERLAKGGWAKDPDPDRTLHSLHHPPTNP